MGILRWHEAAHGGLAMKDCPEYMRCNANICPLDPDVANRTHVPGDPVCFFARESVKEGADARFTNPVWITIRAAADAMIHSLEKLREERGDEGMPQGLGDVLRGIRTAADTGSMIEKRAAGGRRLVEAMTAAKAAKGMVQE